MFLFWQHLLITPASTVETVCVIRSQGDLSIDSLDPVANTKLSLLLPLSSACFTSCQFLTKRVQKNFFKFNVLSSNRNVPPMKTSMCFIFTQKHTMYF